MAGSALIRSLDFVLPSPHLRDANWADAFGVRIANAHIGAREAAEAVLGKPLPAWISSLMRLRNTVVGFLGLKTAAVSVDETRVGAFPVLQQEENLLLMGFDDWHLDFRIAVETQNDEDGTDVRVATLVNRKHWFGYVYIFLITPFHKLIVKRLMANLASTSPPSR